MSRCGTAEGVFGAVVYSSKLVDDDTWTSSRGLAVIVDVGVQMGDAVIEGRGRNPDMFSFLLSRELIGGWLVVTEDPRRLELRELFRRKRMVGAGEPHPTWASGSRNSVVGDEMHSIGPS